jgi:DNA-binding response OmpR family regulator
MKVLMAIPDPRLRALWDGVLADGGHDVTVGGAETDAWSRLEQSSFDLVVLELTPGSTDALEVCRRLRRERPRVRPSILVLVHPDRAAEMVAALKAGADDVLVGLPDRRAAITHLTSLERRRQQGLTGSHSPDASAEGVEARLRAARDQGFEPSGAPSAAGARRATILLIDDDASVRLSLRRALEHCGFDVLEASDGAEGLEVFIRYQDQIDAVVVDQRMPRMSGQQVVEEIKRRQPRVPVVLISGQDVADMVEPATALRADAFIRKPFELVDLARTVRRVVEAA